MLDIRRPKLSPKANMCVFLSFVEYSGACRFLDLCNNSIIKARDVEFFEDKFINNKGLSLKDVLKMLKSLLHQMKQSFQNLNMLILRKNFRSCRIPSKCIRKRKDFGDNFITYNVEGEPQTFQEKMQSKDALLWKKVIDDEMNSLIQNHI